MSLSNRIANRIYIYKLAECFKPDELIVRRIVILSAAILYTKSIVGLTPRAFGR